jgi:hypothetical protein
LTPLDFILRDVYREKVENMNKMHERIVRVAECVTNEMAASTCPETEHRLDVCRATNGAMLRSSEHIRDFVWSSVRKRIDISNTLYDLKYIIFYFIVIYYEI